MNKYLLILFSISALAYAAECSAASSGQSNQNGIFDTIDNFSPIPVDELLITPVAVPIGIVYGASMIALSAVGAVIAAPIAVPMMLGEKKKEKNQTQYYNSQYYNNRQHYNYQQYYNYYQ
ncbi:MAG: hypothetical protein IJ770_03940 [Alphaproteobacteria bacterium]|nr:hypothetical protein [Alphaproteobacteria bacterium]